MVDAPHFQVKVALERVGIYTSPRTFKPLLHETTPASHHTSPEKEPLSYTQSHGGLEDVLLYILFLSLTDDCQVQTENDQSSYHMTMNESSLRMVTTVHSFRGFRDPILRFGDRNPNVMPSYSIHFRQTTIGKTHNQHFISRIL